MMQRNWRTFTDSQRRIPQPWPKPMDIAGKNIANLASVVGNVLVSGPMKTINYQHDYRTYDGKLILGGDSHALDHYRRLGMRTVSPARSRKLAATSTGNPELATLDFGVKYPTGDELRRPLYLQGFPWIGNNIFTAFRHTIRDILGV